MFRRITAAAAFVLLPVLVPGCAGTDHPGSRTRSGVQQVTISTTDQFRFAPTAIRAHVGTLRIVLTDQGSYPHNIAFPALHATSATVSGNLGQRQTTFTVSFAHPGVYEFVCTFHSSAGMRGRVVVS
jgi:plastocyanin